MPGNRDRLKAVGTSASRLAPEGLTLADGDFDVGDSLAHGVLALECLMLLAVYRNVFIITVECCLPCFLISGLVREG
jgi:hypothetical protein